MSGPFGLPDAPGPRHAALVADIDGSVAVGDWATALRLLRENLVGLLTGRYEWAGRLLAAVPEDQPMDPVLQMVRAFVAGTPGGPTPSGVADEQAPPGVRYAAALIQVIRLRTLGRLDEAENVVRAVGPAVEAAEAGGVSDGLALARLHFGILRLVRGDLDRALDDLRVAHLMAHHAHSGFIVRNAAGDMALVHALRGDLPTAERWLRAFDEADVDPAGHFEPQVRVGGIAARAFVALGRLRLDEAAASLDRLGDLALVEELWVFVAVAHAVLALTRGDALTGLAALDEAEASHRGTTATVGIAPGLLAAVRADLLLAVGQGARARAVVGVSGSGSEALALRRARVALVTGEPSVAMPVADAVAWATNGSVRTRTSAFVVAALARWRLAELADGPDADRAGELRAEAHRLLRCAVELAGPVGLMQPFAYAPRDELLEIAAAGPAADQVRRVLDHPAVVALGPLLPGRVPVVELSERELAVLAELATTASLAVVAKRLFVSGNTVKTLVRRLYAKLGAHSREEALSAAYRAGLLTR